MTTYQRNRREGKCGKCGAVLTGDRIGKALCSDCQKANSKDAMASIIFFRSIGLCPRCGKAKLEGEEKMCPECRAKRYTQAEKYMRRVDLRPHRKAYNKTRYELLKEQGLCVTCGGEIEDDSFVRCRKCRIKCASAASRHRSKVLNEV